MIIMIIVYIYIILYILWRAVVYDQVPTHVLAASHTVVDAIELHRHLYMPHVFVASAS